MPAAQTVTNGSGITNHIKEMANFL